MITILPEGSIRLTDVCAEHGANEVWQKLMSGRLIAFHWDCRQSGEFIAIATAEWAKMVRAFDDNGMAFERHPAELLAEARTDWLECAYRWGVVEDDPVIVRASDVMAAFGRTRAGSDQGGRPEHPARAWYAARGFSRGGLSLKELQAAMMQATGEEPPAQNTIRNWEKEAQKPPAKT